MAKLRLPPIEINPAARDFRQPMRDVTPKRPAHAKNFKGKAKLIPEDDLFMLKYQSDWINDRSLIRLMEKSRRVGISYATAYDEVRQHSLKGCRIDTWFSSRDDLTAQEFVRYCVKFGTVLNIILTNGTAGRPQFYLDGSAGNLDLSADFDFQTSSANLAQPAIGNVAGDNILRGDILMTSGGGDTAIAVQGGSLVIEGNISTNSTTRSLRLGGNPGTTGTINGIYSDGTAPTGLRKEENNTWILNGNNTYTAATTVFGGTLLINGLQSAAVGSITVNSGATLGGGGTHGGLIDAAAGSTIAPGTSIGTLTGLGAVTVAGTLKVELDATNSDRLTAGGALNISAATLDIDELAPAAAPVYIIASYDSLTGTFAATQDIPSGYNLDYNYNGLKQIALVGSVDAYASWETLNGIAGAGAATDSDSDGIANGIEFVIGGDPSGPSSNSNDKLPTVTLDPTYINFTYRRTDESASYNPFVEYGNTLAGWTPAQNGVDGVIINETPDGFGAGIDSVEVKIPRALALPGTKLFARLRIDIP